jgi:hypothetical protein
LGRRRQGSTPAVIRGRGCGGISVGDIGVNRKDGIIVRVIRLGVGVVIGVIIGSIGVTGIIIDGFREFGSVAVRIGKHGGHFLLFADVINAGDSLTRHREFCPAVSNEFLPGSERHKPVTTLDVTSGSQTNAA